MKNILNLITILIVCTSCVSNEAPAKNYDAKVFSNNSNKNLEAVYKITESLEYKEKIETIAELKEKIFFDKIDAGKLELLERNLKTEYDIETYIIEEEDRNGTYTYHKPKTEPVIKVDNSKIGLSFYIKVSKSGEKKLCLKSSYKNRNKIDYSTIVLKGSNGLILKIDNIDNEKQVNNLMFNIEEKSDVEILEDFNWKISEIAKADNIQVTFKGKESCNFTLPKEIQHNLSTIIDKYKTII